MARIELDFCFEGLEDEIEKVGLPATARRWARDEANADVSVNVLQEIGPAGGWPVLEFKGSPEAIYNLETKYFGA